MRLRQRARANHRSLQAELRSLIDAATGAAPQRLSIDEMAERVSKLGLTRRMTRRGSSAKTVTDRVVDASGVGAGLFNELSREMVVPCLRGLSFRSDGAPSAPRN
jgi:hypothetical protein